MMEQADLVAPGKLSRFLHCNYIQQLCAEIRTAARVPKHPKEYRKGKELMLALSFRETNRPVLQFLSITSSVAA